jgi:hypothetical protein
MLINPAARHHTGDQCGVDHHLCVFAGGDCVLVPLARGEGAAEVVTELVEGAKPNGV